MLEIKNHTPLNVSLIPALDHRGNDIAVIIIKAKFSINAKKKILEFVEESAEILEQDEYYGEPGQSSIKYCSDLSLFKKSTDIVINGHAYSPVSRPANVLDASLEFDQLKYQCRVFGDRFWYKSGNNWKITNPQPFEKIPLKYEYSFGGSFYDQDDKNLLASYPENPVGKGFMNPAEDQPAEGQKLPNFENPESLIINWQDTPKPAGFGCISPNWQPRVRLAGTYDSSWQDNRMPFLPDDFDQQFYNCAQPGLIAKKYLAGGEIFTLHNLSESGELIFQLPKWDMPVKISIKGRLANFEPKLDTLVIEPDENNVSLTWRVSAPCTRNFLYIDYVKVGQRRLS
jgi:hypothetical protein